MMDEIKNILFSNKDLCFLCKDKKTNKAKKYICLECYERLEIINGEINLKSPYIERVYYSLFYNRFIRDKMADYKFNGKNYLSKAFSEIIVDTIREKEIEKNIDIIFFVASHRRKEAKRGYNQGELLAKYIGRTLNKEVSRNNLVKIRETKDQSSLNRIERIGNLKDSFIIRDKNQIRDKKILLIDDIITTGSTLKESSRVLIENGGKSVIGLTLTSTKKQ